MHQRLTYPDIARIFGTGLIATGTGLLLFVVITIVWGDPFTRITAGTAQAQLEREFATSTQDAGVFTAAKLDPELTRGLAARTRKRLALGRPAGRIKIPGIGVDKVFIHGARDQDLTKGPGVYKETGFPGSGLPVAIAGHRTTHGAPFLNVDKLKRGDKIVLTMPYGRFTYTVTRTSIIQPDDWSILTPGAAEVGVAARGRVAKAGRCVTTCEHLVLTACHPKYSAARRLAVFAKLSDVRLRTGTRTGAEASAA